MESKYAKADKRTDEAKFTSRESVVAFMNLMLEHKFFHRVKTIIVKKEIKKIKDNDSADESHDTKKPKTKVDKSPEAKKVKKEKKKVKFDMHMDQLFVDANEVCFDYVRLCIFKNNITIFIAIRMDL